MTIHIHSLPNIGAYKCISYYKEDCLYQGFLKPNNHLYWIVLTDAENRARRDCDLALADTLMANIAEYETVVVNKKSTTSLASEILGSDLALSFIASRLSAITPRLHDVFVEVEHFLELYRQTSTSFTPNHASVLAALRSLIEDFQDRL